jgi:hypothetical protein
MSETWRDVREQAEWLHVSEKTCRRYAAAMGGCKVGARLLFPESETVRWLEQNRLAPLRGSRGSQVGDGPTPLRRLRKVAP